MKPLIALILLIVSFLNLSSALPAPNNDFMAIAAPHEFTTATLDINGASNMIRRDPATGWCHVNVGLVEHFPRGGSTGGRQASIFIGEMLDGKNKPINGYTWDNGEPPRNERRIDNWTIRVYDLIHRGDSFAFSWFHPDNDHPEYEWLDFNFNGAKWNDRDTNCKRAGVKNCCRRGQWYADGKDRMVSCCRNLFQSLD
ncbi:hypothetical protein N0V94_000191 [Neodidymelliopsis sp. IMI 364377]|nr:hypothetical protein N0V94_000191 [Neodidymelliopsis sp. IMI 364377]